MGGLLLVEFGSLGLRMAQRLSARAAFPERPPSDGSPPPVAPAPEELSWLVLGANLTQAGVTTGKELQLRKCPHEIQL